MYVPPRFREDRLPVLAALVRAHPLALLVDAAGDGLDACHLPLLLEEGGADGAASSWRLRGHVARANPLWERADGADVLCVFQGPQGYVTPSWYASKGEHGRVVPTWNYMVVHVRGRLRCFEDPAELHALVSALTDAHEAQRSRPWAVDDAPEAYVATMLRGIVGLEIEVRSVEGAWKMSQNKEGADLDGVLRGADREAGMLSAALRAVHGEEGA